MVEGSNIHWCPFCKHPCSHLITVNSKETPDFDNSFSFLCYLFNRDDTVEKPEMLFNMFCDSLVYFFLKLTPNIKENELNKKLLVYHDLLKLFTTSQQMQKFEDSTAVH